MNEDLLVTATDDASLAGGEGVLITDRLILDSRVAVGALSAFRRAAPAFAVFLLVLAAWQFGTGLLGLHSYQLPVPTDILQRVGQDHQALLTDGWFTFWNEALRGYLIGSAIGFLAAVAAWRFKPVALGIIPFAVISSAIPIVALAPALIPIAGSDWQSKVIICAVMTAFPMTVSGYRGLSSVDPLSRELLATYGASELTTFRKLHLPASLPFVFNALKINTTLCLIGAIIAEYFGSPIHGLGLFININAGDLSYKDVWAGVLVACLTGILFYAIVLAVERRLTRWHMSYRGSRT